MKVSLAVQTLSDSVANAINYCDSELQLPQFQNASATIEFCRVINNVFDILNTRNLLSKTTYKKPLNPINEKFIFTYIDYAIEYLTTLKDKNKDLLIHSVRRTGFVGLIVCLKSLQSLYNELISKKLIGFILSYKMSQDHLELFFSSIRARGEFNNNPTCKQFEAAYKRLLVHVEIKSSTSTNCLAQDETSILCVSSATKTFNCSDLIHNSEFEFDFDINHEAMLFVKNSRYITDVVKYMAGFICKKNI